MTDRESVRHDPGRRRDRQEAVREQVAAMARHPLASPRLDRPGPSSRCAPTALRRRNSLADTCAMAQATKPPATLACKACARPAASRFFFSLAAAPSHGGGAARARGLRLSRLEFRLPLMASTPLGHCACAPSGSVHPSEGVNGNPQRISLPQRRSRSIHLASSVASPHRTTSNGGSCCKQRGCRTVLQATMARATSNEAAACMHTILYTHPATLLHPAMIRQP